MAAAFFASSCVGLFMADYYILRFFAERVRDETGPSGSAAGAAGATAVEDWPRSRRGAPRGWLWG